MADALARPLSAIFERLWSSREVQKNWRKTNVALTFSKSQKANPGATYQSASLGKSEQVLLEDTHGKAEGVGWEQSDRIYEGDIMTTVTGFGDEGRAVGVIYLHFSLTFETISHNILVSKQERYVLDRWTSKSV